MSFLGAIKRMVFFLNSPMRCIFLWTSINFRRLSYFNPWTILCSWKMPLARLGRKKNLKTEGRCLHFSRQDRHVMVSSFFLLCHSPQLQVWSGWFACTMSKNCWNSNWGEHISTQKEWEKMNNIFCTHGQSSMTLPASKYFMKTGMLKIFTEASVGFQHSSLREHAEKIKGSRNLHSFIVTCSLPFTKGWVFPDKLQR